MGDTEGKTRPRSIDLILTEVDLPSISGYPLHTLIMENDVCKNIPVIMMSSQDSISTVYKHMMIGAADYLVWPIRTNELTRQLANVGTSSEQDECAALQKVEATAENNAASNHSSGNGDKELIEKGSDTRVSKYANIRNMKFIYGSLNKTVFFNLIVSELK